MRQILERLLPILAVREVMRELLVVIRDPIRIELLERVGDGAMQRAAALAQEAVIGDVLDDRVLEDVRRLLQRPLLVDELEALQLAEQLLETLAHLRHATQQAHEELASDNRRDLHRALAVLTEPIQPR